MNKIFQRLAALIFQRQYLGVSGLHRVFVHKSMQWKRLPATGLMALFRTGGKGRTAIVQPDLLVVLVGFTPRLLH
jgi:hypothetical protein